MFVFLGEIHKTCFLAFVLGEDAVERQQPLHIPLEIFYNSQKDPRIPQDHVMLRVLATLTAHTFSESGEVPWCNHVTQVTDLQTADISQV